MDTARAPLNIGGVTLAVVLLFGALFYLVPQGVIGSTGAPLDYISFPESLYLSVITFASMDYGDCGPFFGHWLKYLFAFEGLLGIFLTTLFVATISRKIIRA